MFRMFWVDCIERERPAEAWRREKEKANERRRGRVKEKERQRATNEKTRVTEMRRQLI